MATFSYQNQPFLVDSVYPPNSSLNPPCFPDEFLPNLTQLCPISGHQPMYPQQGVTVFESDCVEQQSIKNEPCVAEKQRTDESLSSMEDMTDSGEQITQNSVPVNKKRKTRKGSSPNSANSKDVKQLKCKKHKGDKETMKDAENEKDKNKEGSQEPPKGYIHVRARRGQATDSHSLAERVRRDKISERMKMLQALVPGCDKVTGKALMLDEIINYVQSLQNQVEFLSLKLASLDPIVYTFGLMDLDPITFETHHQGVMNNNNVALSMPLPVMQSTTASTTTSGGIVAQPLFGFADTNGITSSATTVTTTTTTAYPSPLVDHSSTTSMLQQEQKQVLHPSREDISSFWGVLDGQQRPNIINQFGLGSSTNLCSFQ